jgi:hypothetical protein
MSAYPCALLIVMTMTGLPNAWASCVASDAPAAAETLSIIAPCNAPEPPDGRVTAQQLETIMRWIAERFDLPESAERPAVVFESPARLARMRQGGFAVREMMAPRHQVNETSRRSDSLAVYSDAKRTIYLSEHWSGATEAELSVLVHEVVHHLQNVAGLKYNCPGDREKIAYQAQAAWLRQFDKSLQSEFGLDGPSILVHRNCM